MFKDFVFFFLTKIFTVPYATPESVTLSTYAVTPLVSSQPIQHTLNVPKIEI